MGARATALKALPTLVQTVPGLSQEAFDFISEACKDERVCAAAFEALSGLVQAAPGLSQEAFRIIRAACKDERVCAAAFEALATLVQVVPNRAQEVFEILVRAYEDELARPAILGALPILAQAAPEFSKEIFGIIEPACRQDEGVRSAALGALSALAQVAPGLSQAALPSVLAALEDGDFSIRSAAFDALSTLVQVVPGLSQAALSSVLADLQAENLSIRAAASRFLLQLSLEQLLQKYWGSPDDRLIPYIAPRLYHAPLVIKDDQQVCLYAAAGNPRKWEGFQETVRCFTKLVQNRQSLEYYEQYGEFPRFLSQLARKPGNKQAVGRSLWTPFFGNKDPSLLLGAIGPAAWNRYYGNVGKAPSLPAGIGQMLDSPCPFWDGQQVRDTHLLVLIPKHVSDQVLTLNYLGELIQSPQEGGHATEYIYYPDYVRETIGSQASGSSHWVLMTKDVLPGSRNKSYQDQCALLAAHAKRTGLGYKVPGALEAAVVMLLHYVRSGERLYGDNPWTYTRCQKSVRGKQLLVGGFSSGGVSIIYDLDCYVPSNFGIAGLRKF